MHSSLHSTFGWVETLSAKHDLSDDVLPKAVARQAVQDAPDGV